MLGPNFLNADCSVFSNAFFIRLPFFLFGNDNLSPITIELKFMTKPLTKLPHNIGSQSSICQPESEIELPPNEVTCKTLPFLCIYRSETDCNCN